MAFYDSVFNVLGLREWCDTEKSEAPMSMAQLLAKSQGVDKLETPWYDIPFPSLDNLHKACGAIDQTRDMTFGVETYFLSIKDSLKLY